MYHNINSQMQYFLSLGSNLGDRKKNLAKALLLLEDAGVECVKVSSVYETQPKDFSAQPWFLNQVLIVASKLKPRSFLTLIKRIEKEMGRKPQVSPGPRLIDIDILMAEEMIIRSKELQIPHPRLDERNFVLIPFREVAPNTVHPVLNKTIQELAGGSHDSSAVRVFDSSADDK